MKVPDLYIVKMTFCTSQYGVGFSMNCMYISCFITSEWTKIDLKKRFPSWNQTKLLNGVSDCYNGSSFSTTIDQEQANPSFG